MAQQKAVEPVIEEDDDLIDELQPGATLLKGQYTITRYLNSGGFGITYLAKDSLDRDVVIKECFPSSVCRRSKAVVAARSRAHSAELRSIVQLFVREARNLAKIVHPNIVAVHQVFEDNGTAYMAIDFIDGLDLQQVIDGEGPRIAPDHVVSITEKLLIAVGFIHDNDMLHRDISPDNVLIDQSGEPILIDFGAAREKASQSTRAMSALRVVKDGYSPQEFYIAGSEQGPWSDLYALGATLYHLISGEAPVNGQARLAALAEDRPDPYLPLTGRFPDYPEGFLEAIDHAMCTLPKQRLQSAREWLAMFRGGPVVLAAPSGVEDVVHRLVSDARRGGTEVQTSADVDVAGMAPVQPKRISRKPEPVAAPPSGGNRGVQLVAGVAVALAVVAGGYLMLGGENPLQAPTETAAADAPAAEATDPAASVAAAVSPPEAAATAPAATGTATLTPVEEASAPAEAGTPATTETAAEVETPPVAVAAVETGATTTETVEAEPEAASVETAVEDPAPAVAAETAATEPEAAAEDLAATTEPVVEPAPEPAVEPAVEPATEPAAEIEVAEEAPSEATAEPVAEAQEAPVSDVPAGKPAPNQIAFKVWDVKLPFIADDRIIGGEKVTIVQRILPTVDLGEAGDWLQQGLLIYSVNGTPTPTASALTVAIMNAMQVDPDGKARVVVEYAGSDLERTSALLTVSAVRLASLANGVSIRTEVVDGAWTTVVTAVLDSEITTLQQGDVLFRDKTTSIPLDGPDTLESILAELVSKGAMKTDFSIIRKNKVTEAAMQLVAEKGE